MFVNIDERKKRKRKYTSLFIRYLQIKSYLPVAKALLNNLKESYKNEAYIQGKENSKIKEGRYICSIRYIGKLAMLDRLLFVPNVKS